MTDLIRASALQGFSPLVRELGGDPSRLLEQVGLRERTVSDPDSYIAYATLARAVDRGAAVLACPDFGLRLSAKQGVEILGPIALIARHSATAADGLARIRQHLHIHSPAIAIAVDLLEPATARFSFSILASGPFPRGQVIELSLGVAARIMRVLVHAHPVRVAIPHSAISAPEVYRRHFGSWVVFEQERGGFDFPARVLATPLKRDDPAVRDLALRFLNEREAPMPDNIVSEVRQLIERTLATGYATLDVLAGHLGIQPRTLQRRLTAHGTSFESTLDAVRRDRSHHYLTRTATPMSRIALLVGYTNQSTLSRSCQRWFGQSPRAVRRDGQAAPTARFGALALEQPGEPIHEEVQTTPSR